MLLTVALLGSLGRRPILTVNFLRLQKVQDKIVQADACYVRDRETQKAEVDAAMREVADLKATITTVKHNR